MSTVLRVIIFVATLCMLAGCAQRIAPDAGNPMDAAAADAYHCVEPEPLPRIGACGETRNAVACRDWAAQYAGGVATQTDCEWTLQSPDSPARCIQGRCAWRADGGQDCHCGNEPPCGPGQVCVGDTPDATPYCRCTMQ